MIKNYQRGLTLIELAVIISIIGILALFTIPSFRIFTPSLQLSGAARELTTDLRYAEQLSVTEQIEHGVKFYPDANEYRLMKYGSVETELQIKTLPEKVTFQSVSGFTNNEVKFNPYGAAKETGFVILKNTNNSTTSIDVRPSGFIKINK